MNATASVLLERMESLLALHAEAARTGDADALPGLADQVRQHMATLMRAPTAGAEAPTLVNLVRVCNQTQVALARRSRDTQRALDALGAGNASLQSQRVYGVHGTLAGPGPSSRGLGCA